MTVILIELAVLLLLILANGLFSMSELAIVSARKARLKRQAERGDRGATVALELAEAPNHFLPTVQIGITLVGTLAGAFGGATLAESLADRIETHAPLAPYADAIALSVVVVGITYVTLVLGELVPKRLALGRPESISRLVSRPLKALARVGAPAVRLLGGSTELVIRTLGVRPSSEPPVTEEEVKVLLEQGRQAGIFEASEQEIVQRVFRLGDLRAAALMTPRQNVVWIDVADPPEEVRRKIAASPHSRFPVCDGSLDNVLGVVQVKDLLLRVYKGGPPWDVRGLLILPLFLYEGMPGFQILERFKSTRTHIAMVLDEYGSVEGLITLNDILEALVGALPEADEEAEPSAVRRPDGSWLLDGRMPFDEVIERFRLGDRPRSAEYHTLAGFVTERLGRIPEAADGFSWEGAHFEVVDMDGRRVDKVLIVPPQTSETGAKAPSGDHAGPDPEPPPG